MVWLISLPLHFRIVLIAGIAALLRVLYFTLDGLVSPGIELSFADKDFANYWTAGKLVLSGQTADLFGPHDGYFAHLTAAFGADYPWHNWSYPPHYLFVVAPLGLFDYKLGMMLFLGVTGILYLWSVRRFAGQGNYAIWIAILPFLAHNFWTAQNGYLFAGCGLAALAFRDSRPVLAGVFLGLLTIKPQLGILFPFLLVAERRWLVIISATVTTIALVALSAVVFGIGAWSGYLAEVVPYQSHVMRELRGTFLWMLPSLYGTMRSWDFEADIALSIHLAVALPVMIATISGFFLTRNDEDRSILLLIATFIVTPYALSYDLGLLAPALGLLATRLAAMDRACGLVVMMATLLPSIMIPLGALHATAVVPVLILAVYAIAWRDTGAARRLKAIFRPKAGN
ncbi:glycosyltransferase family 87 protein [Neoaquamicrobium sediminum]|uniref:glycosyltransferase family 87 protein n=1 Tax=Neoaquamicrobium sediminum TaxID=1849104 RepID=UPI003BACC4DC